MERIRVNFKMKIQEHTNGGSFDEKGFIADIINNINLVSDERLFHEILKDAREIFDIEKEEPLWSPFDEETKKWLLDFDGKNGGTNLFQFNGTRAFLDFLNFIKDGPVSEFQNLSKHEQNHFNHFNDMVLRRTGFSLIVAFLESTINDNKFSNRYISFVASAINIGRFYESGDLPGFSQGSDDDYGYPIDVDVQINSWNPLKWGVRASVLYWSWENSNYK
jgi:hypothetical protein